MCVCVKTQFKSCAYDYLYITTTVLSYQYI